MKNLTLILFLLISFISNAQVQFVAGLSWKIGDSTLVDTVEYYAKKNIATANASPKENQYWTTVRIITAPTEPAIDYRAKYDSVVTAFVIYQSQTAKEIAELNRIIDSITKPAEPEQPLPPTDTPYSGPTERKLSVSFTLPKAATVSAGLYNGEYMVRTLFNNKQYEKGDHKETFYLLADNMDTIRSVEGLTVKYITNNLTDEWEGVIGNTSNYYTGDSVHRAYEHIQAMAFSDDNGFFVRGFNEGAESNGRFKTYDPNTYLRIFPNQATGSNPRFCVTDGNIVYFGGVDNFATHAGFTNSDFIYGISAKDFTETTFSKGIVYKSGIGRTYKSAIDMMHSASGIIRGMAVQKKGRFLFVSHTMLNELHIIDKTTGEIFRILVIPSVSNLCIDNDDNLWVQTGTTLTKYQVDAETASLYDLLVVADFKLPIGMAVSPTDNMLAVIDGSTSQQIKFFNNETGEKVWVFGEEGGYANGAEVRNDKFYFSDTTKNDFRTLRTYIAYQPDGSFWVGDICNSRSQHYTADGKFIDRIMFLRRVYGIGLDQNDSTRLFSDYMEFKIDYSKPLKPNNGSWELVRNWGFGFSSKTENTQSRLNKPTTLSNGRTYVFYATGAIKNLAELTADGFVRFCKTSPVFSTGKESLYPDGSMRFAPTNTRTIGGKLTWSRRELTGFNENNDPQWGPMKNTVSVLYTGIEPYAANVTSMGEITSSGRLISFLGMVPKNNPAPAAVASTLHYHLGAINIQDSSWEWMGLHATPQKYRGEFPKDGYFDIANGVLYAAWFHKAIDNVIFHQYNGEFYKGAQTNYWNMFHENGLMLHHFGTRKEGADAPYGMAGNAFRGGITKYGNSYHVYHNDESYHSGVHRWKVSGVNSIEQKEAVALISDIPVDTNVIDIMGIIPRDTILQNGVAGWFKYPVEDNTTSIGLQWWQVKTESTTYDRFVNPDLFVRYKMPTTKFPDTAMLYKDMGNYDLDKWTFKGDFNFTSAGNIRYTSSFTEINKYGGDAIQVLDDSGKVLLNIAFYSSLKVDKVSLVANGVELKSWTGVDALDWKENWRELSFEVTPALATLKIGELSAAIPVYGDRRKPKTFRVYYWTRDMSSDRVISFKDLKLIK